MEEGQLCIIPYQGGDHVSQTKFSKIMQNNELVSDEQSCYVIDYKIDEEYAIHTLDLFENDDAFLEVLGAKTEYPIKHEKRAYTHYPDIHACFRESKEDRIEGLRELPFPLPSKIEMTWLNEEIKEVNISS